MRTHEIDRDRPSKSRTTDTYSSVSDIDDHEHVDDRLVMTLLEKLQDLVSPNFGLTNTRKRDSVCDALATELDSALSAGYRFKLVNQIFPVEFVKDDYISNETVRDCMSRY